MKTCRFCYKDQINKTFNFVAGILLFFFLALAVVGEHNLAHSKGHDNISVETPNYGLYFEGCSVVQDQNAYFTADCTYAEDLGNTIFTGTLKKTQRLFISVNVSFYEWPLSCYQLWAGTPRWKGENEYLFACW